MRELEAMKLALEALETPIHEQPFMLKQKAITALRQAIEQAEKQEPVAWRYGALLYWDKLDALEFMRTSNDGYQLEPLYTSLPQRQSLTDEEILILNNPNWDKGGEEQLIAAPDEEIIEFARAIEAKLKGKA